MCCDLVFSNMNRVKEATGSNADSAHLRENELVIVVLRLNLGPGPDPPR